MPDLAEAAIQSDLGNGWRNQGDMARAEHCYRLALALDPGFAIAHTNLGSLCVALWQAERAIACLWRTVLLAPYSGQAWADFADVMTSCGDKSMAVAVCRVALCLAPSDDRGWTAQGVALNDLGQQQAALICYRRALAAEPQHMHAHSNLGCLLTDLLRPEEAARHCKAALVVAPAMFAALCNHGNALTDLQDLPSALSAWRRAMRLDPADAVMWNGYGNSSRAAGLMDQAVHAFRTARCLDPGYTDPGYNESLTHLSRGDLALGLRLYEGRYRGRRPILAPRPFRRPQWTGQDLAGRHLLIHAEQGYGDSFQFCRFVAMAAARAARVTLEVPRPALRLFSTLAGSHCLIAGGDPLPDFDYHCPMMSLPHALGLDLASLPAFAPYLAAEPERVAYWRERLGEDGFKIGIVWQGAPGSRIEMGRSAPLAAFAPLGRIPGVRLISLQKRFGLDQLEQLPDGMRVETLGEDFDEGGGAFLDSAAVLMSLDLVVTVDTAIGHLAGALGRPVWTALQKSPHWVWLLEREDTPWYPSARLFRQTKAGDWAELFEHMAETLRGQGAGG